MSAASAGHRACRPDRSQFPRSVLQTFALAPRRRGTHTGPRHVASRLDPNLGLKYRIAMPTTRTISAFNTATSSENKIHDDAVASRFGFTGGLVPGVDVFAYLAHMPMAAWGK